MSSSNINEYRSSMEVRIENNDSFKLAFLVVALTTNNIIFLCVFLPSHAEACYGIK